MECHKYSCVPILNRYGKYGDPLQKETFVDIKKRGLSSIRDAENISIMKWHALTIKVSAPSQEWKIDRQGYGAEFCPVVDDQENFLSELLQEEISSATVTAR